MKKILQLIIINLVIILFLSGCASIAGRKSKEVLLFDHLESWEQFRLDGIIELNAAQLRLRKNINISKNEDALSLDIFDSGFFGLKPTPLVAARIDSTFTLEAADLLKTAVNTDKLKIEDLSIAKINEGLFLLKQQTNTIIATKRANFEKSSFFFNDLMQIEKIELYGSDNTLVIVFSYHNNKNLNTIGFVIENKQIITITVDRMA